MNNMILGRVSAATRNRSCKRLTELKPKSNYMFIPMFLVKERIMGINRFDDMRELITADWGPYSPPPNELLIQQITMRNDRGQYIIVLAENCNGAREIYMMFESSKNDTVTYELYIAASLQWDEDNKEYNHSELIGSEVELLDTSIESPYENL